MSVTADHEETGNNEKGEDEASLELGNHRVIFAAIATELSGGGAGVPTTLKTQSGHTQAISSRA